MGAFIFLSTSLPKPRMDSKKDPSKSWYRFLLRTRHGYRIILPFLSRKRKCRIVDFTTCDIETLVK